MKLTGYNTLVKELKDLQPKIDKAIKEELLKIANDILSDALARVPVAKGILRASAGVEASNGGFTVSVYFSAKHAPYVEFGTGPLTEVPAGYEDYAFEFFVSGEGHSRPQPYLFPAFFAHRDSIVTRLETAIRKYVKS